MDNYWITYNLILAGSILTDYVIIKFINKSYSGLFKASVLSLFYSALCIVIYLKSSWAYQAISLALLSASIWWLVKDMAMSLLLYKKFFKLGNGLWDSIFKKFPGKAFFAFKVVVAGFYAALYTWESWVMLIFVSLILTIFIILGWKTKN